MRRYVSRPTARKTKRNPGPQVAAFDWDRDLFLVYEVVAELKKAKNPFLLVQTLAKAACPHIESKTSLSAITSALKFLPDPSSPHFAFEWSYTQMIVGLGDFRDDAEKAAKRLMQKDGSPEKKLYAALTYLGNLSVLNATIEKSLSYKTEGMPRPVYLYEVARSYRNTRAFTNLDGPFAVPEFLAFALEDGFREARQELTQPLRVF
jgi:hypothetical protein